MRSVAIAVLIFLLTVIACLLFLVIDGEISRARAQSVEDCTGRPFVLRPYQRDIVMAGVRGTLSDPSNTRFGRMHGLCKPASTVAIICGRVGRVNAFGYLEEAATFFGAYADSRFYVVTAGSEADAACRKHIYRVPAF